MTSRKFGAFAAWRAVVSLPLVVGMVGAAFPPATAAETPCSLDPYQVAAAIGVPGEAIGSTKGAGVVEIRYLPCGHHATQALRLPTVHANDGFGTSVARGFLNDDRDEDVVVGVPGLDVKGHKDAGGVAVFFGSKSGLKLGKLLTQASKGVPGAVQTGARFGAAVATEGYQPDRRYVVRIGEPGKKVSGHMNAGGFVDLPYVHGKLTDAREVTLATKGIPGSPGTGDRLGAALVGSYAVGASGRKVNGHAGAGAVLVSPLWAGNKPRPATLLTQASPGIPGTPETGDHFGAALTRHWIGAPGESVGKVAGAGVIDHYYSGKWSDNPGFTSLALVPGSHGLPGKPEAGAHFGATLGELGFYVDDTEWVDTDVLVGAPGATVGGHARAGSLTTIGVNEVDPDGGNPFSLTGHNNLLTAAHPATGAAYGTSVSEFAEAPLAVGAPGAQGGRVWVYDTDEDTRHPLTITPKGVWEQQAGTPEAGDAFGAALAGQPN